MNDRCDPENLSPEDYATRNMAWQQKAAYYAEQREKEAKKLEELRILELSDDERDELAKVESPVDWQKFAHDNMLGSLRNDERHLS